MPSDNAAGVEAYLDSPELWPTMPAWQPKKTWPPGERSITEMTATRMVW